MPPKKPVASMFGAVPSVFAGLSWFSWAVPRAPEDANLGGTFGKPWGNLGGTLGEPSGNLWKTIGDRNLEGTLEEKDCLEPLAAPMPSQNPIHIMFGLFQAPLPRCLHCLGLSRALPRALEELAKQRADVYNSLGALVEGCRAHLAPPMPPTNL